MFRFRQFLVIWSVNSLRFGISCLIGVVLVASVRSSAEVICIMADKTARIRTLG